MTDRESSDSKFAHAVDSVMLFGPTALAAYTVFPSLNTTENVVVAPLASPLTGVLFRTASGGDALPL